MQPQENWVSAAFDVTFTQANAAGGAIIVDIANALSSRFVVLEFEAINSGTNAIQTNVTDSANKVVGSFGNIASGAGTVQNWPTGSTVTSTAAVSPSNDPRFLIIAGTDRLTVQQTGAGAQNDTFRLTCRLLVYGAVPTLSVTRSTNAGNVSATAGSATVLVIG